MDSTENFNWVMKLQRRSGDCLLISGQRREWLLIDSRCTACVSSNAPYQRTREPPAERPANKKAMVFHDANGAQWYIVWALWLSETRSLSGPHGGWSSDNNRLNISSSYLSPAEDVAMKYLRASWNENGDIVIFQAECVAYVKYIMCTDWLRWCTCDKQTTLW